MRRPSLERLRRPSWRLPPVRSVLLAYECRILRLSAMGIALGLLGFVTAILIFGPPHRPETAVVFFEDLVSLVFLTMTAFVLAVDQEHRTLEFVLLAAQSPWWLYVRRYLLVLGLSAVAVLGLAFVWSLCYLPLPVHTLLRVALPPTIFVATLSYTLSLLTKSAHIATMLASAYWLAHQILHAYGDQSWFGYLFLFKVTYYPKSASLATNRCALLLAALCLLVISGLMLRRAERYLR